MSEKKPEPLETVVLLKAHTHAGKTHKAGAEISVSPVVKKWLMDNEIAEAKAAAASKKDVK